MHDPIDVDELLQKYSLSELVESADAYFAGITDPTYHLVKPLAESVEASTILAHFAGMLSALQLKRGMRLLDFGCGTCWTTRWFAQLGMSVTGLDVSPAALQIGRELFRRHPIIGEQPPIELMTFEGMTIPFPDECFDRISVMDAFHRVPNQRQIISEFHRVLKPGGYVVFAEPGPEHSRTPQSQHEMRQFKVVERDIDVRSIEEIAIAQGFAEVSLGVYAGAPFMVSVERFEDEINGGEVPAEAVRHFLTNHRLIRFIKNGRQSKTSRNAPLSARLSVTKSAHGVFDVTILNNSTATWFGTGIEQGAVNLGAHLFGVNGELLDWDYLRMTLKDDGEAVEPGEVVVLRVQVNPPPKSVIEFDLVSEGVAWFAEHGSSTVRI